MGTKTPAQPGQKLTLREAEVWELLAMGLTAPEIASQLGISRSTAESHGQNIKYKFGVHSRGPVGAIWAVTQLGPTDQPMLLLPMRSRNIDMLIMAALGKTRRSFGRSLFVEESTVQTHIKATHTRLEIKARRALLAVMAVRAGLVYPASPFLESQGYYGKITFYDKVMDFVATGKYSAHEISELLDIPEQTVVWIVAAIRRRTGWSTNARAVPVWRAQQRAGRAILVTQASEPRLRPPEP